MTKSGLGSNSEQQRIWKALIANTMDTIFICDTGNTNKYSRKKVEYLLIHFYSTRYMESSGMITHYDTSVTEISKRYEVKFNHTTHQLCFEVRVLTKDLYKIYTAYPHRHNWIDPP
jgi:hypothetical protein